LSSGEGKEVRANKRDDDVAGRECGGTMKQVFGYLGTYFSGFVDQTGNLPFTGLG